MLRLGIYFIKYINAAFYSNYMLCCIPAFELCPHFVSFAIVYLAPVFYRFIGLKPISVTEQKSVTRVRKSVIRMQKSVTRVQHIWLDNNNSHQNINFMQYLIVYLKRPEISAFMTTHLVSTISIYKLLSSNNVVSCEILNIFYIAG